MSAEQCRFMAAAYPMLDGYDTCAGFHKHDQETFDLAAELAIRFQGTIAPSSEQVAWFLNDAQAIISALAYLPEYWHVGTSMLAVPRGCDQGIVVAGTEFLIPESEWEPATPILRKEWLRERDLTEHDIAGDEP